MNRLLPGILAIVASALIASIAMSEDDVEYGRRIYLEQGCYACHGYDGIGRHPIANNASGFLVNETVFKAYLRLRADLNPDTPSNSMPNYSAEVLDDDAASALYAYVKTLADAPPEIEAIPVFIQILESAEQAGNENSGRDTD